MTAPKVSIAVGKREFVYWEEVSITRSLDNFSTVELSAPFEPESKFFRDTFKPFTYQDIIVKVDEKLLFTGQLVGVEPAATSENKTVRCAGYALPAVLNDSTMPASEFPIEYGNHTLRQIAETLARPFGINVVVDLDSEDGPQFKKVRIKPTEKIGSFLAELARARGLVMRDDEQGRLVFLNSAPAGKSVCSFVEGEQPLLSVAATFSPQAYYSEITGFATMKAGRRGSGYTERNKNLPDVVRPLNFTIGDVNAGDLPGAVKAKMARMFGNMVAYVLEVPTWHDPNGVLWAPNSTVTLYAPGAMVYREIELLVRDVTLRVKADSVDASIGVVLPGAFSGQQPEVLPWA